MWSVFFVFLSYLDRNFVKGEFLNNPIDAAKESKAMFIMLNNTFCATMSVIGENYLYQVSDGIEKMRSVYSPSGKLVDCSVTVNQMQVKAFMHLCRLGLKDRRDQPEDFEGNFAHMVDAKFGCEEFQRGPERTSVAKINVPTIELHDNEKDSSMHEKNNIVLRSKRGFTYPGTLWCGAGNMAEHYDQLGNFAETDSCCRIHDHCPHVIHAFSSKFGYTNFNLISVSHCDCDNTLKACLRKVNDTSSRIVGQAFFNVMEVPCFEFAYEEQCVERHWYGVCKKYEMVPVAVAKESVPYDFGGIDVIDVLTVSPPKQTYSKKDNEQEKAEGTTQSTVSGSPTSAPEEPSLGNVVIAAEDFIKVLATVSTSQSSTTDSSKGEAQTSDKKKKKNSGKRRKNSKKRNGKGRKRKQKIDAGIKVEDGATVTQSSSKVQEDIHKSSLMKEQGKVKSFIESTFDLGEKYPPSNDVMKDEPGVDEKTPHVSVAPAVEKEQVVQKMPAVPSETTDIALPSPTSSTPTVTMYKTKRQRSRKREGRRKQKNLTPRPSPIDFSPNSVQTKELPIITTDSSNQPTPTKAAILPLAQLEQQGFEGHSEKRPDMVTANIFIVTATQSNRQRSTERGERWGRKKNRKSTTNPILARSRQSFVDIVGKVITSTSAPNVTTNVNPAEWQEFKKPEAYGEIACISNSSVTCSSLTSLQAKRLQSKGRVGRKKRGKIVPPPLSRSPSPTKKSADMVEFLTARPERTSIMNVLITTTAMLRPTVPLYNIENPSETSATVTPSVTVKTRRSKQRAGRKRNREIIPTGPSDGVTKPGDNEPTLGLTTMTGSIAPTILSKPDEVEVVNKATVENKIYKVQTSIFPMSPVEFSIQRAKHLFGQKKKRKATVLNRTP